MRERGRGEGGRKGSEGPSGIVALDGQEVVPRRQGAQGAGLRAQDGLQARRADEAGVWRGGEEDALGTEAYQGLP